MNRVFITLATALLILGTSSCALLHSGPELSEQDKEAPLVLDLFAGRGFAGGAEYERYHLTDGILWRECGTIDRKKQDKIAKKGQATTKVDPNLRVENSGVVNLTSDQLANIKFTVRTLLTETQKAESLPPPGALFTMLQPGTYELELTFGSEKKQLTTALDSVSNKTPPSLASAYDLFVTLRSSGDKNACTDRNFFGVSR